VGPSDCVPRGELFCCLPRLPAAVGQNNRGRGLSEDLSATRKRQIAKISADIARIEKSFFETNTIDLDQRYYELQRKREHLLRSIILELHLSIEDVITGAIGNALLQGRLIRSPAGHAIRDLSEGQHSIQFLHKLMLARSIKLITPTESTDLSDLNTIRNRCSHSWLLNKVTRRKIKRSKPKKRLLRYRGANLYETKAFLEFVGHFSRCYVRLWLRVG
jgi:hypothetical protein